MTTRDDPENEVRVRLVHIMLFMEFGVCIRIEESVSGKDFIGSIICHGLGDLGVQCAVLQSANLQIS